MHQYGDNSHCTGRVCNSSFIKNSAFELKYNTDKYCTERNIYSLMLSIIRFSKVFILAVALTVDLPTYTAATHGNIGMHEPHRKWHPISIHVSDTKFGKIWGVFLMYVLDTWEQATSICHSTIMKHGLTRQWFPTAAPSYPFCGSHWHMLFVSINNALLYHV